MSVRTAIVALGGVCVVMVLGAHLGAGADEPAGGSFPAVMDVDLAPNPACSGDVAGSAFLFSPLGGIVFDSVEYRVSVDDVVVEAATVPLDAMEASVAFTVAFAEIPEGDGAELVVEARHGGGAWSAGYHQRIWRDCDPLRVKVFGDSVAFGMGNRNHQTWHYLLADALAVRTGHHPDRVNLARTGVVLDRAGVDLPDDANCDAVYADPESMDRDGDGEIEFGDHSQGDDPDVFCQVRRAGQHDTAAGTDTDVVFMTGCINDVNALLGILTGVKSESVDLDIAVERECLGGVAPPGGDPETGGRGLVEALAAAHALPGAPKVVLVGYYRIASRASVATAFAPLCAVFAVSGLPLGCENYTNRFAERSEVFYQHHTAAARSAVAAANAASPDGQFATFVDAGFLNEHSALAPEAEFWNLAGEPSEDVNHAVCVIYAGDPVLCPFKVYAHPNVQGGVRIRDAVLANPDVLAWFGDGDPANVFPTAALSADVADGVAPFAVNFDASGSVDTDGSIVSYRWVFGDGTAATTAEPEVAHTYRAHGIYFPQVVVTDDAGGRASAAVDTPVTVDPGLTLEVTPALGAVDGSTDDIFAFAARTPAGSDIATGVLPVEYRWDFDGDGSIDRTTAEANTAVVYGDPVPGHPTGYGPGSWPAAVSIAHKTVSFAEPTRPFATATVADPVDVAPGCVSTDADTDGIPCRFDPDADTAPYRHPLVSATGAGVALGDALGDTAMFSMAVRTTNLFGASVAAGNVAFRNIDTAPVLVQRDLLYSIAVTGAVASGPDSAYITGIGLCVHRDISQFFGYTIRICNWQLRADGTDIGGRTRLETTNPATPIRYNALPTPASPPITITTDS